MDDIEDLKKHIGKIYMMDNEYFRVAEVRNEYFIIPKEGEELIREATIISVVWTDGVWNNNCIHIMTAKEMLMQKEIDRLSKAVIFGDQANGPIHSCY